MKKILGKVLMIIGSVYLCACGQTKPDFCVQFDSTKEVSGQKFALKDLNSDLPADWDGYNYVVVEFKSSTAQRFQLGFTTETGYNELRIMSYVPNAWNKLAIPLKFFTDLPDPRVDLAATNNYARYTGWINLGGKRGPLHQVDSIGLRMRKSIGNPTIELRSISLSVEDPGDVYMDEKPAVDEFGLSNLMDWPGKIHSLDELQRAWKEEERNMKGCLYDYSKYGGYMSQRIKGTGFFRTENIDGRWWLVDPEGYLFLSVGVDCVGIGNGLHVRDYNKRSAMYIELPPEDLMRNMGNVDRNGEVSYSYGLWNLYRRYGDDFKEKSIDMVFKRMDKWGINTIANWSSRDIMLKNKKAFLVPLSGVGIADDLMGLCDIYDPSYTKALDENLKKFVKPFVGNPWLIGYFIGNEPAWLDEEGRLCEIILQGKDRPIKRELEVYLQKMGDTMDSRTAFIIDTFSKFLKLTDEFLKKHDPQHLNLGIRFGNIMKLDERILRACGEVFDVFSFNCYDLRPNPDMLNRASTLTGLPLLIGEYHFGTVDRGMAQSLWQVDSQEQRGVAYRYYTENAYAHPALVGTGYFQWCDQDLTGRRDGENYNCGLIDVTDRPYEGQVQAMMETAKYLYKIHKGERMPFDKIPNNACGHELIPDLWNE